MSKPANTAANRKLRSDGPVDEDTETEVMFKTPNGKSRTTSRSDSERTLDSEDTLSTSEQNGEGDDDIGVIDVEQITINADVTGDAERNQAALRHQATPFVPAPGPMPVPPPAMDPNRFAAAPYETTSAARQGRQRRRDDKCRTGGGGMTKAEPAARRGRERRHRLIGCIFLAKFGRRADLFGPSILVRKIDHTTIKSGDWT